MIYFLSAILLNAILGFIFKWMGRHHVPILPVIVINYVVCAIIGLSLYHDSITATLNQNPSWLYSALLLGIVFVAGFFAAAKCVGIYGMGVTAILQRISLIITILFATVVWKEQLGFIKILGLFFAFAAIFLVNKQTRAVDKSKITFSYMLLPFFTFLASGIIDSTFYHTKRLFTDQIHDGIFTTTIFTISAIIGTIIALILYYFNKIQVNFRILKWGLILGIPNFFSVYTLIKAIDIGMDATVLFPIYNMSIILIAGIGGFLFFKEKLYFWNIAGMIFSIIAILLISL
jgi:drug/metabolite transporter (DMT)-like permease